MGLDMYLFARFKDAPLKLKEEENHGTWAKLNERNGGLDLGYWRKEPNLHGYIVQKHAGGVDDCQRIYLSREDLLDIINAVENKALPKTTGFFFGEDTIATDKVAYHHTLHTLYKAVQFLDWWPKNGPAIDVIYQASW